MRGMADNVWQLLTAFVLIAVIFMLVRPGSPATQAVKGTSDALTAMLRAATGYKFQGGASSGIPNATANPPNNNPIPA